MCSGGQGEFDLHLHDQQVGAACGSTTPGSNKTVETLPDGSTNTVYTNAFGQVMLSVFTDYGLESVAAASRATTTRVASILQAGPSVVTGYSESNADLVGYSSGNASYLDDDDGLVIGVHLRLFDDRHDFHGRRRGRLL